MFLSCKHSQHKGVQRNLMTRKQRTAIEYFMWRARFPVNPRTLICHVLSMTIFPSLFIVRNDRRRQGGRYRMFLFGAHWKPLMQLPARPLTFFLLEIFHNYNNTVTWTSENHKLDRSWLGFRSHLCRGRWTIQLRLEICWSLSSISVTKTESLIFMSKTWWTHSLMAVFTPKNIFL